MHLRAIAHTMLDPSHFKDEHVMLGNEPLFNKLTLYLAGQEGSKAVQLLSLSLCSCMKRLPSAPGHSHILIRTDIFFSLLQKRNERHKWVCNVFLRFCIHSEDSTELCNVLPLKIDALHFGATSVQRKV